MTAKAESTVRLPTSAGLLPCHPSAPKHYGPLSNSDNRSLAHRVAPGYTCDRSYRLDKNRCSLSLKCLTAPLKLRRQCPDEALQNCCGEGRQNSLAIAMPRAVLWLSRPHLQAHHSTPRILK